MTSTTVIQFPDRGSQPLTSIVSAEIRALMGRHQVSQERLAWWLGLHQTAVSARLHGRTEWKVAEIDRIAEGFGVHPAALMGGYADPTPPGGPNDGLPIFSLPRLDSNQQPFGSLSAQVSEGDDDELAVAA